MLKFDTTKSEADETNMKPDMQFGFYIVMGGLRVVHDERLTLTPCGVINLADICGYHNFKSRPDQVTDKSKADNLAKLLVFLQVIWIGLSCINRWINDFKLSVLEVHTLAHALCALVMWGFWFHKPLEVRSPSETTHDSVGKVPGEQKYANLQQYSERVPVNNETSCQPAEKVAFQATLKYIARYISRALLFSDLTAEPISIRPARSQVVDEEAELHIMNPVNDRGKPDSETGSTLGSSLGITGDSECDRHTASNTRSSDGAVLRQQSEAPTTNGSHRSASVEGKQQPAWIDEALRDLCHRSEDFFQGPLFIERATNFDTVLLKRVWSSNQRLPRAIKWAENIPLLEEMEAPWVGFLVITLLGCVSSAYAAIHLALWTYRFPTTAEDHLWKICGITLASALPIGSSIVLVMFFSSLFAAISEKRRKPDSGRSTLENSARKSKWSRPRIWMYRALVVTLVAVVFTIVLCWTLLYVFARVFLVVESFISLRRSPQGVFDKVGWAQYFPHL